MSGVKVIQVHLRLSSDALKQFVLSVLKDCWRVQAQLRRAVRHRPELDIEGLKHRDATAAAVVVGVAQVLDACRAHASKLRRLRADVASGLPAHEQRVLRRVLHDDRARLERLQALAMDTVTNCF